LSRLFLLFLILNFLIFFYYKTNKSHQVMCVKYNNMTRTIKITPADELFTELGNVNYTLDEALSELIDNSISARDGNSISIDLEFYLDNSKGKCERIIIRDNALGISEKDIDKCISPAGKQTTNSLNEHGLGLKSSIASLGKLKYLKSKTSNECGFKIEKFSWEIEILDDIFTFNQGTEISIDTNERKLLRRICRRTQEAGIKQLSLKLGSRYRRLISKLDLKISLNVIDGTNIQTTIVNSVTPLYFNAWNNRPECFIYEKIFTHGEAVAKLTFGYAPKTEQDYTKIDANYDTYHHDAKIPHPYRSSTDSQGLDLIMNDRVIAFSQMAEINLSATRHPNYNQIRGEIIFENGFLTTSNKTNMIKNDNFVEVMKEIKAYLTTSGKPYTGYTNLISNKYLQGSEPSFDNENSLKTRIAECLEPKDPHSTPSTVVREFVIEQCGLKVDLLVNGIPWEVKNVQCTCHDISQLMTYMILLNVKKGVIVSPTLKNGCEQLMSAMGQAGYEVTYIPAKTYH
jgi:anti-sigma regulatory factor (Ser/Thr protein kinase)